MRKFIVFFAIVLLSSCEINSSDNGDLDNMWYLVQVDSLKNGNTVDYRPNKVFWSFQGTMVQMNKQDKYIKFYQASFKQENGCIKITNPFLYNRISGDRFLKSDSLDEIRFYGINSIDENFQIENMSKTSMILNDEKLRLTFEKY